MISRRIGLPLADRRVVSREVTFGPWDVVGVVVST